MRHSDFFARSARLSDYLLALGHKSFGAVVQPDDEGAAFVSNYCTVDYVAFSLGELGIDAVSFVRFYSLNHNLLGGLGGYSAELFHINRLLVYKGGDLPAGTVDLDGYFAFRGSEMLPYGRDHRFFKVGKDGLLVDILVSGYVLNYSQ